MGATRLTTLGMKMWINPWSRLLDAVAPRRCACCGQKLSITEDIVCLACLLHIPRTNYWANPLDNRLARLFWGRFPVERAAAYFFYHPHSSTSHIILQLKYQSKPWVGTFLGRYMGMEMKQGGFFEGVDALIPMPLSRKRKWQRGYNQSERIAQGISEVTGIPVETKALKRTKFKQSQTRLTPYERQENVEGLFVLADKRRIEGKHVMLVDDVITTGSTVCSAALALSKARGVTISIVSAAFTWSGV